MEKGNPEPPPPYGFVQPPPLQPQPQPQQVHTTTVIQSGPGFQPVGPNPQSMVCPSCHHHIRTRVDHEATGKTHIIALLLCIFLCWPCICLPYCCDCCKNANHYCPNCKAFLGSYRN